MENEVSTGWISLQTAFHAFIEDRLVISKPMKIPYLPGEISFLHNHCPLFGTFVRLLPPGNGKQGKTPPLRAEKSRFIPLSRVSEQSFSLFGDYWTSFFFSTFQSFPLLLNILFISLN
ncbi:hypothetical protein [uncultured Adlercreutzia sp.]|uniref:hypothetical protein n=1 Tax=uncultured Adlercreutzia sp. TaxID=875803 RepID=UPI002676DA40|nr:hypothetical protein [uncultured Adlercreutzia sp.]